MDDGGYREVASVLAGRADGDLLGGMRELGAGVGGRTGRVVVGDVPVFVKRIALTGLEVRQHGSTANLFGLPAFYQYGVGSAGFGAWRELAAHRTTTDWVLDGRSTGFPLMYHWRVLPSEPRPAPEIDRQVSYWDGDEAVRRRLEALAGAEAELVVFLEHVPQTLHEWLTGAFDDDALRFVERELFGLVGELRERGIVHFDAHPGNVLCDGRRLYLGDLGLWLDREFELSPAETAMLAEHRDWDRYDVARYLVNWVCGRLAPQADRRDVIQGRTGLAGYAGEFVRRHGAVALIMNDFYDALVRGPKTSPYPVAELAEAARRG